MHVEKNGTQVLGLQLSKSSPPEVISNYFRKIFELNQTGKEFPVNLNDAWPLAYGRKEDAVRALKASFIEDVHFQVLRKNAENPRGGRPVDIYWLTVPCLEFFIASKVHPVFEVYRQVFHAALNKHRIQSIEKVKRLQERFVETDDYKQALDLIDGAVTALGSSARLADRIGINQSVLTHIRKRPWLVSDEKLHGIELACRNLLARENKVDTEAIEQLMQIDDAALRMSLFTKMKQGGLI